MREKERTTGVIFVRHGETNFQKKRLYCDEREDPTLTGLGQQQARHAAELLADQHVDVIYASPMQRTRSTAAPIVEATGAPLHIDERLKERPFGIWDGMYFDDIAREYPEQFQAWRQDQVHFVPEGGETIDDHRRRVTGAVRSIIDAHPGKVIVIVSHVGPIRVSLTDALTMPLEAYRRLTIDYGSLSRVEYGEQQNNLIYLNFYSRT